jgi:periplasmic protein TonB
VAALTALRPNPESLDDDAGSPVVFIELAPMAVTPPAPASDLALGPVQSDSEYREAEREVVPPQQPREQTQETDQIVPPVPAPPPMQPPQETERTAPLDPAPPPLPAGEEIPKPDVVQPPATKETTMSSLDPVPSPSVEPQKPSPVEAAQEPPSEVSVASAPPSTTDIAPQPAGPETGRVKEAHPPQTVRWQLSLVAHIERFKRYPKASLGEFGVARLAFKIDRQGRLLSARIVNGSGSLVLDDQALATIRRAEPFPTAPEGVSDDELSFVLPIRYAPPARRQRPFFQGP